LILVVVVHYKLKAVTETPFNIQQATAIITAHNPHKHSFIHSLIMDINYVTELNPNDVLFGRGSGPNDHEGNIKFRDLVSSNKPEYLSTSHRQTKANIARGIVDKVFAQNGRFLKKMENADAQRISLPSGIDAYVVVDSDTIMEKAKQALRQNREKGTTSPRSGNSPERVGSSGAQPDAPQSLHLPGVVAEELISNLPVRYGSENLPLRYGPATGADGSNGYAPRPLAVLSQQMPTYAQQLHVQQQNGHQMPDESQFNDIPDESQFLTYTTTLAVDLAVDTRRGIGLGGVSRKSGGLLCGRRENTIMAMGSRDGVTHHVHVRRPSMEMSELVESFKGMNNEGSSGTIDTIDPMGVHHHMSGLSNMSVASISSGNSFFKDCSSHASLNGGRGGAQRYVQRTHSNDKMTGTTVGESRGVNRTHSLESMTWAGTSANNSGNMSMDWNSKSINNLLQEPLPNNTVIQGSSLTVNLNTMSNARESGGFSTYGAAGSSMNSISISNVLSSSTDNVLSSSTASLFDINSISDELGSSTASLFDINNSRLDDGRSMPPNRSLDRAREDRSWQNYA
jgi:hypothetical protein